MVHHSKALYEQNESLNTKREGYVHTTFFVIFSFRGVLISRSRSDVMPVEKSRNWALLLSDIPNKPFCKVEIFTLKMHELFNNI